MYYYRPPSLRLEKHSGPHFTYPHILLQTLQPHAPLESSHAISRIPSPDPRAHPSAHHAPSTDVDCERTPSPPFIAVCRCGGHGQQSSVVRPLSAGVVAAAQHTKRLQPACM
ncbi:hypothetical protein BKA80DRAFT_273428 [Phyllosticta citrichinensis]